MSKQSKYQEKRAQRHQENDKPTEGRIVKTITGVRHSDACHAAFKLFKEKRDAFLAAKDVFLKTKDELRVARGQCQNCLAFKATQGFNMGAAISG